MFNFANYSQVFRFAVAQTKKKTYYQILELPSNASVSAIKKNYYKLAKIYHPDVYKGKDHTRFQKIQQAYKTLSDQGKRRTYDEEIGLKSPSNQQAHQNPKEDFGKPQNPMDYDTKTQQINIDEQYQKFFSKKNKTQFQEIRMHQNVQFRNMSEAERIRRQVRDVYQADAHIVKNSFQQTYNTILNDQIDQKNQMFKDAVEMQQKMKQNEKENVQKKKKRILIGVFIVFCMGSLPIINSILTKQKLQKKQQQMVQKWWEDAQKEAQKIEIRQRFQY